MSWAVFFRILRIASTCLDGWVGSAVQRRSEITDFLTQALRSESNGWPI